MIAFRSIPSALRLSLAALSLAFIFFGWSVARSINTPEVVADRSDTAPVVISPAAEHGELSVAVTAAVESDPFNPLRTKPATRYRLAHEMVEAGGPPQRSQLRWAGIIVAADPTKSILSASLGNPNNNNNPVSHLRVGDKIGEFTLKSFDMSSATFESESGEMLKIFNPTPGRGG